MLRARVEAPKLAAKLAAAGVRFAFEDGGMTDWSEFLANAGRSVENGLTADQAVRALTTAPAEILGVGDRLGTIETGKIANLTVTRGDLFAGHVVQRVRRRRRRWRSARQAATGAGVPMANGTWTVTVTTDEGEKPVTLALQQFGDQLRGTHPGRRSAIHRSRMDRSAPTARVQFTATVTMAGGTEEATFPGTIAGNVIRGTVAVVGHPQGTFIGQRPDACGLRRRGRRGRPPRSHQRASF